MIRIRFRSTFHPLLWPTFLVTLVACTVIDTRAPEVEANGPSFVETLALPTRSVRLTGSALDNQLPTSELEFEWQMVTGPGDAVFTTPTAANTRVTFSAAGSYLLRLSASDGMQTGSEELSITVLLNGVEAVISLAQANRLATGFDDPGMPRLLPSPDPSGIAYHPPSGHLFISDSEIDEEPIFPTAGGNLFEVSPDITTLFHTWDLTASSYEKPNNEPSGITFCEGHFYLSNDNPGKIFRYRLDGDEFLYEDRGDTTEFTTDPEGITCDEATGRLFVIGGSDIVIVVFRYLPGTGFEMEEVLDLVETAGDPSGIPTDPEGIAFDPVSRRLLVVSDPDAAIFEYETTGRFVRRYDIGTLLSPSAISAQGLTIGPSSDQTGTTSLYIADAGRDPDEHPGEFEGAIYEMLIEREDPP